MSYPTPTSPTLNDIEYQYFSGLVPVLYTQPAVYDGTATREAVTLNLVGYTAILDTEDFTITSENASVSITQPGPSSMTVQVSDLTVTSEFVGEPDVSGTTFSIAVSDTEGPAVDTITVTHT